VNREEIEALRASNEDRIAGLRAKGAEIPQGLVIQTTLDLLIEHTLPEGSPERDAFDEAYVRAMEELILQGEQYLNRLILTGVLQPDPNQPGVGG